MKGDDFMELFALLISEITIIAMSIIATILFCFIVKNIKREKVWMVQDDGTSPKFYITGDKHRNFTEIKKFCREMHTKKKDVSLNRSPRTVVPSLMIFPHTKFT